MKKLSIMLALILVLNIFVATSFVSAEAVEGMPFDTFDFNSAEGTVLDAKLKPSDAYTCAGYEKVDDEHGLSLVMGENSRIRYNFADEVEGAVVISFDMYAKGDITKFWVTSTDTAEETSNGHCYLFANPSKWVLNWWGAFNEVGKYSVNDWHHIDFAVSDIRGNQPLVKYYIDNTLVYEKELGGQANGYVTFSGGGAAGSELLLDNITFSKEMSFSEDFNSLVGRWNSMYSAKIESLESGWIWEGGDVTNVGPNWYNVQKAIDAEHGISLGTGGSAAFYHKLPATVTKDATLSFELYTENNTQGTLYIQSGTPAAGDWNTGKNLAVLNGSNLNLAGTTAYALEENKWYKVDMKFTVSDTCTVDYYINGIYIHTAEKDIPTHITFKAQDRSTEQFTFIDNLKFTAPFTKDTFTVAGKDRYVPELDKNVLTITFDETVNMDTWDDSFVSVTDVNGQSAVISHTDWNKEATVAKIHLEDNLAYDTEYTINLPAGLTSVFGETCASSVTAKTTVELAEFEDFNDAELTNRINTPAAPNAGTQGDGVMNLLSDGVDITWCQVYYRMPYAVDNGVVKVSFDQYLEGIDAGKTAAYFKPEGAGTITTGLYWLEDADGVTISPCLDWDYNIGLGDYWTNKNWHHYDLIFDLDGKSFSIYMDGHKANTNADKYMEKLTSMTFNAGAGNVMVDNFSVRYYDNLGEFETDLAKEVKFSKETINISFKDAVNTSTLEEIALTDSKGNLIETIEVTNSSAYDATVTIGTELTIGETYTLSLNGVKTVMGTDFADKEVVFKAVEVVEKFEITDVKVLDGSTIIGSAADWNDEKEYKLSIDVENTTEKSETIHIIVAGYDNFIPKNIKVVPVSVSESGKYQANLGVVDMDGATVIKIFAFNSLQDLAPLMAPSVQL